MAQPGVNLLLQAYERRAGRAVSPRLEAVSMPFKHEMFRGGQRPRHVHFITSGLSSLVALLSEGREVEVGMTAHEGFPEAVHLMGPYNSPRDSYIQVPGTALRLPFAEAQQLFQKDELLRELMLRFLQYQTFMASQLTACNGLHTAEERLARWLLMVQNRVGESVLPLTQELLGTMLGSRRSTVTIAAGNLQRAGMIEYRRGTIRILNEGLLVDTACECYGVIEDMYDQLYK